MRIKIFTLPNLITCLNLVSGCLAINAAMNYDWKMSFWWVVIAAVFDFLDGFVARLTRSYSETGKQLDSLADMVSFGAAPAFILYSLMEYAEIGRSVPGEELFWGWLKYGAFLVVVFSALRLAKFNVDTRQSEGFIGLPTPANALLIASLGYMSETVGFVEGLLIRDHPWVAVAIGTVLSVLLISEIPMFSLKFSDYSFARNKLRYLFVIYGLACLVSLGVPGVFVLSVSYILFSVLVRLFTGRSRPSGNV